MGYGEVGKGVADFFDEFHIIEIHDPAKGYRVAKQSCDVLLVAIPYNHDFIATVQRYQRDYEPRGTIIFSTVAIGTTKQIDNAIHSPIEGKHPHLEDSIRIMQRWVGGPKLRVLENFFAAANLKPMWVKNPDWTEFLKLYSTSKYGVNIEYARYAKTVADSIEMPFEYTKLFDEAYNHLYTVLGQKQFQRYVLDAPDGIIGGHCIRPNSLILDEQFPSVFLKLIKNGGESS